MRGQWGEQEKREQEAGVKGTASTKFSRNMLELVPTTSPLMCADLMT